MVPFVPDSKPTQDYLVGAWGGFLLAGAAFVWTWIREHRIEEKTQWLLTDDGLTSIVRGCIREPDKEEPNTRITKRQIVHEILYLEYPWHKIEFIRRIPEDTRGVRDL